MDYDEVPISEDYYLSPDYNFVYDYDTDYAYPYEYDYEYAPAKRSSGKPRPPPPPRGPAFDVAAFIANTSAPAAPAPSTQPVRGFDSDFYTFEGAPAARALPEGTAVYNGPSAAPAAAPVPVPDDVFGPDGAPEPALPATAPAAAEDDALTPVPAGADVAGVYGVYGEYGGGAYHEDDPAAAAYGALLFCAFA